jgi:hypothetical protein
MKKEEVDLLILTPGHGAKSGYVRSLVKTLDALNEANISYDYYMRASSHVSVARQKTLDHAMDDYMFRYKKMLWIDSDIEWEPEDVFKLYNSKEKIISGAYLSSDGYVSASETEIFAQRFHYDDFLKKTGVIEAKRIGFGFVMISKGVFESIKRPYWEKHRSEEWITGEDIAFCENAYEADHKIYLDTSVKVNHYKTTVLTWNGWQSPA